MGQTYPVLPSLFWISGPPAAGKTTLCGALLARFERGLHLPVDDLRGWVVQGMADSVPWTDETERQFRLAETAACEVARRYHEAGFGVAIDGCRNPARLDTVFAETGIAPVRVLLMPDLETNLRRSHTRQNKTFNPRMLDETILYTNARYREDVGEGWLVVDNAGLTIEATVETILASI